MVTKHKLVYRPAKRKVSSAREPAEVVEDLPVAHAREIPAGEFKARCLALMDEVGQTGGEYVITKRGVPVARLLPARVVRRPLLGSLHGSVKTRGDIVRSLDEPWGALGGFDGQD
jgi:prevent-host-death family protein